jgi:hypothetical protein
MVRLGWFLSVVFCLFASLPALASIHVWTGAADDRFSNASNWIGGSPAADATAAISFPVSSRTTATNDLSGLTVQSIGFTAGGFTIGGNAITLAANASVIDTSRGTNTIACNLTLAGEVSVSVSGSIYDAVGLVLSGAMSGTGGVTLRGGGHLVYSGAQPNTYSGLTQVLFGELQLKKAPNVTAIAGDLVVESDGFNYEYGYLSIFNDEQIANSSHVTVGYLSNFGCGATETLGPVTLTRFSTMTTSTKSGETPLTGKIIFAGDVEVTGSSQGDIANYGTFLLQGMRTINATANFGQWNNYAGPGQATPGSGIIVNAESLGDGADGRVLEFHRATYDGPTILKGGSVSIDAPLSAVDLQNGGYSGHCKSLTAEGGLLNLHSYFGGVISDGDVRLSSSVILAYEVGNPLTMNGLLELGGATLKLDATSPFNYGAVYKVIDNTSSTPASGTLANLPEGSMVADRYRISYAGGDGNDVTLTDFGLVPSSVSVEFSVPYPQTGTPFDLTARVNTSQPSPTGTVTFSADATVLGSAPLTNGAAKLTTSLPRGHYMVTAAYSGDARVAPATASGVNLYVVAPKPTLTSIDPPAIPGGVKTTLTLHGTNFVDGCYVLFSSSGYPTTFVSPTELRVDFAPFASESAYQVDVWVSQPDVYGAQASAHMKLDVSAVTRPPSPFAFGSDLTATLKGVTPGAMTLWFAVVRSGNRIYEFGSIVGDTDHDGSVALKFPFTGVTTLPPFGVWLVADLNAHTIVADNPSHTASAASPLPPKPFLRDADGHYTHVQFTTNGYQVPSLFGWARPAVGAWMMLNGDGGGLDEDGPNRRVTFETPAMQKTIGTTAAPPTDGMRPGDMFLAIDTYGDVWSGDAVDGHLSESDGPGKLGFAVDTTYAAEASGSAKVLVERTEGTDGTVTVKYATADDTATAGRNYVAQAGTLTFGNGEIFKTITIPLIDDSTYGGDVRFKLNLSDAAGASLGMVTHTVTITDDERPPVLSLQASSSSVPEGDKGRVDIPITVKLTGATTLPVTASWNWSEHDLGGSHTGQLQFEPGETQKTFAASYTGNITPEPDRRIDLNLFNLKNATASDPASITIIDDDFARVSLPDASVSENAGKVTVPLLVSGVSKKPITVTYVTRNGTAYDGVDYAGMSGTVTVEAGSAATIPSITIPILNDNFHEPLREFEIVLTSVNGGKIDRSTAAVIIVDDDPNAPPRPPAPARRRSAKH